MPVFICSFGYKQPAKSKCSNPVSVNIHVAYITARISSPSITALLSNAGSKLTCSTHPLSPPLTSTQLVYLAQRTDATGGFFGFLYNHRFCVLVFTALHGMQTRSSDELSVSLSVRLSVCLSNACIVT